MGQEPPDLNESLRELLGPGQDTEDETLVRAARESWRRRIRNTYDGANSLSELRRRGYTLRDLEQMTGIPKSTITRWATPPIEADPT